MVKHRAIDVEGDGEILLGFHCRINYASETPYARRMTHEEYRRKWLSTSQPDSFLSHLAETMKDERKLAEILEDDGEVAGYLWVAFIDVPGYEVTIAEIMDVAVSADDQHRGIGQRMMRYIEGEARRRFLTGPIRTTLNDDRRGVHCANSFWPATGNPTAISTVPLVPTPS